MLRIAILGCGRIGKMHAANVAAHPRASLAMVYDTFAPAAEAVGAEHNVAVASSPDDVFSSGAVDAVLVATAPETHADYIERAVAAGKPVLCEKPFCLTANEAREVVEAARDRGLFCMEAMWTRFLPTMRELCEKVRGGAIGPISQLSIDLGFPYAETPATS